MPQPVFKNIDFTSQARLPVTGVGFGYDSIGEAKDNKVSAHFKCLDGEWDFLFYYSVSSLPEGIELIKDFKAARTIAVPADWQFFDYGYNWIGERYEPTRDSITPPDDINGVGVYHRTINITTQMLERELYLQLDGVGSAAEIYLNGNYIGFCQSAYDGHRFCLADFAIMGENHLTIIVYRYSHGSCLEDRDSYRMSGLFRSVWLCGEPIFCISNARVVPKISQDNSIGTLDVDVELSIKTKHDSLELWGILYSAGNNIVAKGQDTVFSIAPTGMPLKLELSLSLDNPHLWSDENPYRYRLVLYLQDNHGSTLDLRAIEIGFRQLAVTNGRLMLNHKPLKLYGTEYEEWHPDYGRALPEEQLLKDLQLIKRCNFNAIKLSRPASDRLYDICDDIGLLVITHPAICSNGISRLSSLVPFIEERIASTVTRLKNHPCIAIWDMENDAGIDISKLISHVDIDRPTIGLDVVLVKERNLKAIKKLCEKPSLDALLLFDFIDVNGNGLGNLCEFTGYIRECDNMAGLFISNFIVTASWNGNNFYILKPGGILQPDRTPNPTAFEIKQCYSTISMSLDIAKLTVTNNNRSAVLKNHFVIWEVRLDGLTRESERIDLPDLAVDESIEISIPYKSISTDKALDLVVNLYDENRRSWSDDERSICNCHSRIKNRTIADITNFVAVEEEEDRYVFNEQDCRYEIDKQTGLLSSVMREGFEFIKSPLRPQIARVVKDKSTEYESRSLLNSVKRLLKIGFWQEAENTIKLKRLYAEQDCITADFVADGIKQLAISYRCSNKGELVISFSAKASQPTNRLGITFETVPQLQELACFSHGPNENYLNRNAAAVPVLMQGGTEELCHHYLHPSENGNRTGAEWLMVYGTVAEVNRVMLITSERPVDMSVHPYPKEALLEAKDIESLAVSNTMTVNIDAANSGIGEPLLSTATNKPETGKLYEMKLIMHISRS